MGSIKNIRMSDVVAKVSYLDREAAARSPYKVFEGNDSPEKTEKEKGMAGPIMITGIPGHAIEDVVLENIEISYPGFGSQEDANREVPEDIARYPEQFFFGPLPAWGAYIRHAKNVTFKNVTMKLREQDARERIVLDDVEGFKDE